MLTFVTGSSPTRNCTRVIILLFILKSGRSMMGSPNISTNKSIFSFQAIYELVRTKKSKKTYTVSK